MKRLPICLGTSASFRLPDVRQIRLFRQIGFDGFFTGLWSPEYPMRAVAEAARSLHMLYQSVHAPFGHCADLWRTDAAKGEAALNELLACLESCRRWEVPVMICHAFIGFDEHTPTAVGLERYGKLIRAAEGSGVRIAFENTEGEEYLAALMQTYGENPAVGFCWDSGHELCYNRSRDLLAEYGSRLIATHLNDNLGIGDPSGQITWLDDLHLPPYDGIADWGDIARRLRKTGYDGPLTFELTVDSKPGRHENDAYAALPLERFLSVALQRARRFADRFRLT